MKFQPKDAYEPEPVELSPARQRLLALHVERDAIMSAVNAETASSAALARVHDGVAPARAELAAFDADYARAMANWSKGLTTGRPKAAAERRAELAAALADAELASAAAKTAQTECQSAVERMSKPLAILAIKISDAAKVVAIEEGAKLLPEMRETIAKAERLRLQLDALREESLSGIEFASDDFRVSQAALVELEEARRSAESRPFNPPVNPHAVEWRKFVGALQQDAAVGFEDAQAMTVTPTITPAPTIDPVSAAAAAVESFSSTGFMR